MMPNFEDYVREQGERDPSFLDKLEQAKAELRLGIGISERRQEHGWSQRELAERAAMPQSTIARYELAGNAPSLASIWRLADTLDSWFVFGPDHAVAILDQSPCLAGQLQPVTHAAAETTRAGG